MKKRMKIKGRLRVYLQASLFLGILLAFVNLGIYFLDIRAAFLMSGAMVFYFAVVLILLFYNKPIIMNELISFATEYGQIQRALLRDMEIPYILMDESGKVMWSNDAFNLLVHKENGYRKVITNLFPTITKEKLLSDSNEWKEDVIFDDREFELHMKKVSLRDMAANSDILEEPDYNGYMIAAFFFDNTALKLALRENDNQSLAVGMIYLDNYEEALDSVEEVRRSLLTALVDRKINKYIAALDGITKKIEKDKFLIVLRKESVLQLAASRFDLLDDVKTVNIGNEMAVTLSIGIGLDGLSYAQNYEFSRTAIDLALGRGGDQAVVKTSDNITYYGGKSQQVEKNTRVKARVKAHALSEIITSKDKVIVMGHRMADVDSFGAAVGIYRIALELDRKAHIVLNEVTTSVKPLIDMLKNNSEYEEDMIINNAQAIEAAASNSVLIVVDVNKPSITECPELLRTCKSIVVLDHHRQGTETIENATLSYVEPYASSACEMVTEILQYVKDGIKPRNEESNCLYSGIMIDTNNFMTKTGVRTFEAAAYLRRNGTDVTRVRKLFREDATEYKAKADAVSHAQIYRDVYAISVCKAQGVQSPTIVGAQAANELLNIKGIKASFILTDYQDRIFISARSIDEVNVQIIMERMGGGGHMNTAGVQLEGATIEDAMNLIKETLDAMIEEGELQ
ncbi:MAG: DHH family phosphoesterase [Lachnospiraceae bacterium]|nr:DHH family phosphoesterase [Lachnospiraceae bacterium]